jgi:soluble lytic murein transglycosylase-like protein
MKFTPQNLIIPAVLVCCTCFAFLSMAVNTGYAQPAQFKDFGSEPKNQIKSAQLNSLLPKSIQQWKSDIETNASTSGLDPNLIAAVILQESGGNSLAYSTSGAVGLMQVMPKDGIASQFICGSQPCFINRPSIDKLLNPEFNIQYGTNYLAELIRQKGSIREALKVYGPMDIGYSYADTVQAIYEKYQ